MTEHNVADAQELQLKDHAAENEWMEMFKTALWAVLLALVIRTFFFEPFNIPSGSMKPNLLVGDYLFVSKYSYGYSKYSLPFALPVIQGRVMGKAPQQGDVAVFKLPTNTRIDYIKRVIGMPGDRIQMMGGRLQINNKELPRVVVGTLPADHEDGPLTIYRETLPNGVEHLIYEVSDNGPLDTTRAYIVPEGHYFMMGDNRDNSQDSRVTELVGFVPYENFVGKAQRIFFSIGGHSPIWEFWQWPVNIRYSRLFKHVG